MHKFPALQQIIGKNIKRLRLRPDRRLGINALAKAAGIGNNALTRIEAGDANPELDTLYRLANKLGISHFWYLFVPDFDPEHPPHLVTADEMKWHLQIEEMIRARTPEGETTGKFPTLRHRK